MTLTVGAALCPIALLSLLLGFLWAIGAAFRDGITQLKRLHSIPCDRCVYYTGCQLLKCTVHPTKALTEDAVECLDFEPVLYSVPACQQRCKH
ncbi:hypothetical protein AB3R30_17770 [Leptolyngbyaceae cyanobacterium UHCC 1019]